MSRRAGIRAFVGGLLLAGALPLLADEGFREPASRERLAAGSWATASWRIDPARLGSADEMELVLSLDGGRRFPLRVTARIDPARGQVLWRVPAFPTDRARLALRTGLDEDPSDEAIALLGPEFEIVGDPRAPLEEISRVGDEWRTREALPGGPVPDAPDADAIGVVVAAAAPVEVDAVPQSPNLPAPRFGTRLDVRRAAAASGPADGEIPRPRTPVPLRE